MSDLLWGAKWRWPSVILFTALLLSVGYQAWRIFPYTPLSRAQAKSSHFPIYAALSFHPEMDAAGKLPAPRPEEKKEAEKTVEKAKEKQR
jgi:hypothetical protein